MENKQNTAKQASQPGEFMRIQDLFYLCLSKWYWFVISMVIALGVACFAPNAENTALLIYYENAACLYSCCNFALQR